jgi:hypothetical protein
MIQHLGDPHPVRDNPLQNMGRLHSQEKVPMTNFVPGAKLRLAAFEAFPGYPDRPLKVRLAASGNTRGLCSRFVVCGAHIMS